MNGWPDPLVSGTGQKIKLNRLNPFNPGSELEINKCFAGSLAQYDQY
jgi:hypothetical protein